MPFLSTLHITPMLAITSKNKNAAKTDENATAKTPGSVLEGHVNITFIRARQCYNCRALM